MNKQHKQRLAQAHEPWFIWPESVGPNFLILAAITAIFFWKVLSNPHLMLWANDLVRMHSTYKQVQWDSFWKWHAFPLWDPTVFGGRSIVGDPIPGILNLPSMVFWLIPTPSLFGFFFWMQVTLSAWGMFLFSREKGCNAAGAVFAAVAFALGGKTAAHVFAGHIELLSTMLGLPWILWAAERLCKKPGVSRAALLGAILAIVATYGSVQAVYLHVLFTTVYVGLSLCAKAWQRDWRGAGRTTLFYGTGLTVFAGAAAAWWFPVVRQTLLLGARSRSADFDFATMNSMSYSDLLRFIWPFNNVPYPKELAGDAANGFFWETASYPGLLTLLLAIACLVAVKNRPHVFAFAGLGLVALFLALGNVSPLYWLAYRVIPGFDLFRAPGRMLFYVNFVLAFLAGLFVSQDSDIKRKWFLPILLAVLVEVFLFGAMALPERFFNPSAGRWIPCLVAVLLTPLAFFWVLRGLHAQYWRTACVTVIALELFVFWGPHIKVVKARQSFLPISAAEFLAEKRQEEEFRVYDPTHMIEQQVAARHGLEIITGYHPGIYAHHLELYKQIWPEDDSDIVELRMHSPNAASAPVILDLMNVEYVAAFEPHLGPDYEMVFTTPSHEYEKTRRVFRRKDSLPRAFLVASANTPQEGESVLEALGTLDPRKACLVEDRPIEGSAAYQSLDIKRRNPGDISMRFATEESGVAVISQSWHPDWRATDNGKEAEVRRVNHGLLGVAVQPGEHELRVWYSPWDFYAGLAVSVVTWMAIVTGFITHMRLRSGKPT